MKLRLAARGVGLSAELKDYIGRRVHFSLGRFAEKIRSLFIHLSDVNGPRGGLDKCCDIRVNVGLSQEVIVRERQANIHAAVAFAVDRAERAVGRQLKLESMGRRMATARTVEFEDEESKRMTTDELQESSLSEDGRAFRDSGQLKTDY